MSAYEVGCRALASGERVAVDEAYVLGLCELALNERRDRLTNECFGVSRSCDLAACYCHEAAQVYLAGVEQTTEEDNGCGVYSPNHLALVHGSDVVHLHAYVACRASTVEHCHLYVLSPCESSACLLCADAEIGLGYLCESRQTGLEIALVALEFVLEVAGKRHIAQCAHEDGARLLVGSGRHSVRKLVDVAEQAGLKQSLHYGVAVERSHLFLTEVYILLLFVSVYNHAQYLAAVASDYCRHYSAHW